VSDAVRSYVEALKERQKAERSIRDVVEFIKYVSNALERDVNNFAFDGVQRVGASRPTGSSYESAKWPSAKGLQELLIKWDDTRRLVQEAWDAMPADDRAILPSPDRRS
jgi:hypothetical protein